MLFVDNLAIVLVFQGLFPILLLDLFPSLGYKRIFHAFVTEDIVRGYTGLTAVQIFTEHDPLCSQLDVGACINDTGTLTTQFQDSRCQMLCRVTKHFPAHRLAAGEEHKIKLLLQQSCVLGSASRNHRDILRCKTFRNDLFDDPAGGRRIGAGFYDGGIACSNGICKGIHCQQEGVIPGTHNQRITVRHRLLETMGRKLRQRSPYSLSFRKFPSVANHIGNFRKHQAAFAHEAFEMAFAQVFLQRVIDLGFVFFNGCIQLFKLRDAEPHRNGHSAFVIGPLLFKQTPYLFI